MDLSLLITKFRNARLRTCILDTNDAPLMEWINNIEGYWERNRNGGSGRDMLGEILMEIRSCIRQKAEMFLRSCRKNNSLVILYDAHSAGATELR